MVTCIFLTKIMNQQKGFKKRSLDQYSNSYLNSRYVEGEFCNWLLHQIVCKMIANCHSKGSKTEGKCLCNNCSQLFFTIFFHVGPLLSSKKVIKTWFGRKFAFSAGKSWIKEFAWSLNSNSKIKINKNKNVNKKQKQGFNQLTITLSDSTLRIFFLF